MTHVPPGERMPGDRHSSPWAGVVAEWVRQLVEPLVPTERRVATEARLVRCAIEQPAWAAVALGGVISDLTASVPAPDPVRHLGGRLGPLWVGDGMGNSPDVDGVISDSGELPAGFAVGYSDAGLAAQSVFGGPLPEPVQSVLALTGAAASGRRVELEVLGAAGPWADVFAALPVGDLPGLLDRPWVVAGAALLAARRRAQLDDPDDVGDGSESAPFSAEVGGRALAVTGAAALRWALWNRREYLGSSWPSDQWPARSAVQWSLVADVATRGLMTFDDHWDIEAVTQNTLPVRSAAARNSP